MGAIKGKKNISETDVQKIRRMASLGLTRSMMSAILGMSEKTLERRIAENSDVETAVRLGEAEANAKLAETAYAMATSGSCPAMTIFLCKTRLGWREKDPRVEVLQAELKMLSLVEALRAANLEVSNSARSTEIRGILSRVPSDILTGYVRGTVSKDELREALATAND